MLRRFWFWLLCCFGRDPRGIFTFWDGQRWHRVDPIPMVRALMSDPLFCWNEHPNQTNDPNPDVAAEAIRICADAARATFGIPDFQDGGLTETECCCVLWAFMDYLAVVKKNGSGPATSPPPTAPTPSGAFSDVAELDDDPIFQSLPKPTKLSSDSGSMSSEPVSASAGT